MKCPVISSIIADDPKSLEGIAISVNEKGLLSVTKGGLPGAIRDANSCDLGAPADDFDLSCDWTFPKEDAKQAERTLERLRQRIDECLPATLREDPPFEYTPDRLEALSKEYGPSFVENIKNTQRIRDLSVDIELDDGGEVEISLDLTGRKDSGRQRISLTIYR